MIKKLKKVFLFLSKPRENYANLYLIKYHLLKAVQKMRLKNGEQNNSGSSDDMFNWSLYNLHYRGELKKDAKNYTLTLRHGDYDFTDSALIKINKAIRPLHQNWQMIYETVLQLFPSSVLELGCGNGMHLHNIKTLAPQIKLYGLDWSEEQIKFLRESYPNLDAEIKVADATVPWDENRFPQTDLSFTQAVIMHIHTGQTHLTALRNLFNASKKYVILMERWKNHRFMDDIKKLHGEKKINWDKIYFYYRLSPETGKPHMMICSKTPLNYPILTDYDIMPEKIILTKTYEK
jgi:SAM-dependent methyltransferase